MDDGHTSSGERNFCKLCGTALWLWDPDWPELVHPHAGAIDTDLPEPPDYNAHDARLQSELGKPMPARRCHPVLMNIRSSPLAQWHKRKGLEL